jgi:alpha-glucan phosphorylase-like protein
MTTREKLHSLSRNLWWSWHPEAIDLFQRLNRDAFRATNNNPLMALRDAQSRVLEDPQYQAQVDSVYRAFRAYMDTSGPQADAPRTSYFCMEYGLHESLPLYSGGLGILAGDHIKAASDVGMPLTAVGMFLRDGYFRQYFDEKGQQHDEYPSIDATFHPMEPVRDADGHDITVTVHFGHRPVHIRAWRLQVGKTTLYLLDTDFGANPYDLRFTTRRLYQGDRTTRIRQEIVLGIGGLRLLRKLGVASDVYHMNEGHCAFLTLELLREQNHAPDATETVRRQCVFTTHTPVMAGHDRFDAGLFLENMSHYRQELGLSEHDLMAFGRVNADDPGEQFTMTVLGLRLSRNANGVSKLNGEVARRQWMHLYHTENPADVPIGHVTNGVHLPTWAAPASRTFLNLHLGDWQRDRDQAATWSRIEKVSDSAIWAYRGRLRSNLIDFVNDYTTTQTLPQSPRLRPDALTIGFARRFATYKRAPMLFHDLERVLALFADTERPIQVIYAGKAHPQDEGGQRFIQEIFEYTNRPEFDGRLVFLENYNMEIGRKLVSGCDVWLNNPRRPYEASGTSGMKVAIHGGLNLSIPDGWWPEGYDGTNGWSIGDDSSHEYHDPAVQDPLDAALLYEALQNAVIPRFYERDGNDLPTAWISMIRRAMSGLTYRFSAHRMILDYIAQYYTEKVEA